MTINIKKSIEFEGIDIVLSCKHVEAYTDDSRTDKRGLYAIVYKYKIFASMNKHLIAFDFFGSIADHENGIKMTEDDLPFTLYCFVSDALAYQQHEKEDFLEEFGYMETGKMALKGLEVYEACKQSWEELYDIWRIAKGYKILPTFEEECEEFLCDLLNYLQENHEC